MNELHPTGKNVQSTQILCQQARILEWQRLFDKVFGFKLEFHLVFNFPIAIFQESIFRNAQTK